MDGQTIATRLLDGSIIIEKWPELQEIYRFNGPPGLDALAYDAGSRLCAISRNDGAIEVWEGNRRVHELQFHTSPVKSLSFSRDASRLAAESADGTVSLWDPRSGVLKHQIADKEQGACVLFDRQDVSVVALVGQRVKIIDAKTGQVRQTLDRYKGRVYKAAFDRTGKLSAVGDKTGDIVIWDMQTFAPRTTLSGHTDRVFGCCFSPSGQRVVSCGRDGTIRWWDVETARELCVPLVRGAPLERQRRLLQRSNTSSRRFQNDTVANNS